MGTIVAVKGLGGYHLACDARNEQAVAELRRRKRREGKPLAVMVGSLEMARQVCVVSQAEAELLESPARPIVLLKKRAPMIGSGVVDAVASRLSRLGLMLPYTPRRECALRRRV